MDYCPQGDLALWDSKKEVFVPKWQLPALLRYLRDAAEGLAYCNSFMTQCTLSTSSTVT